MAIIKTKETWGNKALVKRISTLERIPSDWRLKDSDIERAARQRDLTSPFVEELLDPATAKITALDTADIVSSLQNRKLSALQVTTAFCQAAAVAHEIVSQIERQRPRFDKAGLGPFSDALALRTTASMRFSSIKQLLVRRSLIIISRNMEPLLGPCMGCRSVSRTSFTSRAWIPPWAMLGG